VKYTKYLAAAILSVASLSSFAISTRDLDSAGWQNLSESQKADVLKAVADTSDKTKKADPPAVAPPVTPTVAEAVNVVAKNPSAATEWASVGVGVAQGLAAAAKELGVAVNDFAKTTVGQWTLWMIVWHIFGKVIIHIIGALIVLAVGMGFVWELRRRLWSEDVTYSETAVTWWGAPKVLEVKPHRFDSDGAWGVFFATAATIAASLICLFTY